MKKLFLNLSMFVAGFVICLSALKMNVLPKFCFPQAEKEQSQNGYTAYGEESFYAQNVGYSESTNSSIEGSEEVGPGIAKTFIEDYQFAFLSQNQKTVIGSLGGQISIADVKKLVNECNTCSFINFRLGYETAILPANRKVRLLLSTGSLSNISGNEKIYTNSGDSFCPTRCD